MAFIVIQNRHNFFFVMICCSMFATTIRFQHNPLCIVTALKDDTCLFVKTHASFYFILQRLLVRVQHDLQRQAVVCFVGCVF